MIEKTNPEIEVVFPFVAAQSLRPAPGLCILNQKTNPQNRKYFRKVNVCRLNDVDMSSFYAWMEMHRPYMQYGMCCPCMWCENFPLDSESEEASRKRGLGSFIYQLYLATSQTQATAAWTAKLSAQKIDLWNWILWPRSQDLPVKQATF